MEAKGSDEEEIPCCWPLLTTNSLILTLDNPLQPEYVVVSEDEGLHRKGFKAPWGLESWTNSKS